MTPPTGRGALAQRYPAATSALILVAAAFALRGGQFGNPLIHVDENFYLLVGDRMLHGALPYVDIWDRKPVGLFVLYAAIRLLGGDGVPQYQIIATLFAAGTAMVVVRLAAPMAGRRAAVVAGIVYLMLLGLVGGSGGQAPVFYNLLTAGAALATLKALSPGVSSRRVRALGAVAMGLIGLGLQIKYNIVFEGVFFGLALMGASWKASRSPERLIIDVLLWVGLAAFPTLLALAWYARLGHLDAFVYANFLSIGDRAGAGPGEAAKRLGKAWGALHVPVFAAVLAGLLEPWRRFAGGPATYRFVLAWLGAALFGYLVFGTYFNHYALPLLLPLAVACAPLFAHRPRKVGLIAAVLMLCAGATANIVAIQRRHQKRGGAAEMAAVVDAIRPRLRGCLYVWNGDPLLYHLTGSCLPTRWPFAGHLNLLREHGAIGVDQVGEIRRILAGKPSVIVDREPIAKDFNFEAVSVMKAELARDYRPVKIVAMKGDRVVVYERIKRR